MVNLTIGRLGGSAIAHLIRSFLFFARIAFHKPNRFILIAFSLAMASSFVAAPLLALGTANRYIEDSSPAMFSALDASGPGRVDDIRRQKQQLESPALVAQALQNTSGIASFAPYVESNRTFVLDAAGEPIVSRPGVPSYLFSWHDQRNMNGEEALHLTEGRMPAKDAEIVLPATFAADHDLRLGQSLEIVTAYDGTTVTATLVGLGGFHGDPLIGAPGLWATSDWAALITYGNREAITGYWLDLEPGTNVSVVQQALNQHPGMDGVTTTTGAVQVDRFVAFTRKQLGVLTPFLIGLTSLAVLVSLVLVVNNFRVITHDDRRMHEHLRFMGASSWHSSLIVLIQAVTVTAAGLILSAPLVYIVFLGLRWGAITLGVDVLPLEPAVPLTAVGWGATSGVLVAAMGSWRPLVIACRLGWRQQLPSRKESTRNHSAFRRFAPRATLASVAVIAAVATTGVAGVELQLLAGFGLIGTLFIVGTRHALTTMYLLLRTLRGERLTISSVAVNNLGGLRQLLAPAIGTATLCVAALIGLSSVAASIESSIESQMTSGLKANLVVQSSSRIPFPDNIAREVRDIPGVSTVDRYGRVVAEHAGGTSVLGVVGAQVPQSVGVMTPVKGQVTRLGANEAILEQDTATKLGVSVGDTIPVTVGSAQVDLRVTGLYRAEDELGFSWYVNRQTLADAGVAISDASLGVTAKRGASDVEAAVRDVLAAYPLVDAYDAESYTDLAAASVYEALDIARLMLLAIAAVAAVATANALLITVVRRSREFAVMYRLGASRRQLQQLLVTEGTSVGAVVVVLGAMVGLALAALVHVSASGVMFNSFAVNSTEAMAIGAGTVVLTALTSLIAITRLEAS